MSSELVASNFVMTFQVMPRLSYSLLYPPPLLQAMFLSIVLGTSATATSSYILFTVSVLQFLVDTLKVGRIWRM